MVRTRMPGGVGGGSREASPYPDWDWLVDGLMEAGYRVHLQPVSDSTV